MARERFTADKIIELVQATAKQLGQTPTLTKLCAMEGTPCANTVLRKFGSWDDVLRRAGLERARVKRASRRKYTRAELIAGLQHAALLLERVPTMQAYSSVEGVPSYGSQTSYFRTWNNALRAAGFNPNRLTDTKPVADDVGRQMDDSVYIHRPLLFVPACFVAGIVVAVDKYTLGGVLITLFLFQAVTLILLSKIARRAFGRD